MSFTRQVERPTHCHLSYTNVQAPSQGRHVPQRAYGWETVRTSHSFQWSSDDKSGFSGPGHEKSLVPGQDPGQRIVLHIDDDEEDRMLLEEALQKLDATIKVHQVDSGKTALSFLQKAKEHGTLPCMIILDINMPGMNGKEVLKEIKKDNELASLPLILFTTSPVTIYSDLIKKENILFITKPLKPSELINSARTMLQHCPPN